jgi:hypothetical protein
MTYRRSRKQWAMRPGEEVPVPRSKIKNDEKKMEFINLTDSSGGEKNTSDVIVLSKISSKAKHYSPSPSSSSTPCSPSADRPKRPPTLSVYFICLIIIHLFFFFFFIDLN